MNTAHAISFSPQMLADAYVTARAEQRVAESATQAASRALLAIWSGSEPLVGVCYVATTPPKMAPDGKAALAMLAGAAGPLAALAALAAAPPGQLSALVRQLRLLSAELAPLRNCPMAATAARAASVRTK